MNSIVYILNLNAPPIDRKEVLRYAGAACESEEISALLDECIAEIRDKLTYKVCYREFDALAYEGEVNLDFCKVKSSALCKNLTGCRKIILFAATIGVEIDRLISRAGATSAAKATMLQALGSERVEALCDVFNDIIKKEANSRGYTTRPRVSAGYGDIPLDMQKDIFAALDCTRKIGITLGESLLMSPSKSVTAIIGLQEKI